MGGPAKDAQTTRTRPGRLGLMIAMTLLAILALAGCGTSAEEMAVPVNVLPEEGQATVYEFYTDS